MILYRVTQCVKFTNQFIMTFQENRQSTGTDYRESPGAYLQLLNLPEPKTVEPRL